MRFIVFLFFLMTVSACSLIEKVIESSPGPYRTRECCYMNATRDTIFYSCKNKKPVRLAVIVADKMGTRRLLDIDTALNGKPAIPLGFIYKAVPMDTLEKKYFHIIVEIDERKYVNTDYWFILDSADLHSGAVIYSRLKVGR